MAAALGRGLERYGPAGPAFIILDAASGRQVGDVRFGRTATLPFRPFVDEQAIFAVTMSGSQQPWMPDGFQSPAAAEPPPLPEAPPGCRAGRS